MSAELCYRFGSFRLLPAMRTLHEGERTLKVGSRALDMLLVLIERRERVVGKDELLDLVWPGLIVEENNLQVHVAALRKLLGHPAITTVPGRGYRFTMRVNVESGSSPPAPPPSPAQASPVAGAIYGREREQDELRRAVAEARLVTVSGAGGIGKSHLARALADELALAGSPVFWIDLAPLSDGALLARTVGRGIGLSVDAADDAPEAIANALRYTPALLVLDGAEHLLEPVAALAAVLLRKAGELRLLVTSQEPLRMEGEHLLRLPPLKLPDGDSLDAAADCGAVQLFAARARASDARFRLDANNVAAVVDVCRRLDGIALAIVLAAGRVGLLGVEGLRSRLHDRFQVLTAGSRVALRRHQTLRAALEWTCGLLGEAEQAVLRRLGCFAGGFTLEAAQSVCADEAIDQWDVLEHLGSLVDKSVVLAEGDDLPRYRMLDTTRLFALERLADAGETTLILGRHAATMAELLGARAQWRTRWMSSAAQFRADASEIDNARAALEWTSRGTDDLLAIQVAAHTAIAFVRADMGNEYLQRALPVRSRVGAQTPLPLVALLWLNLARCGTKSSTADTLEAACHAVALYRRLGELPMLYEAIACAILIGANRAGAPPLQPWVEELRAVEQADWPPALLSFGRWALYRAMRRAGQDEQALQLACEQVQLSAQRDPIFTLRIEGVNVVDCEIALGRLEAAEQRARGVIGRLRAEGVGEGLLGPVHELLALTLILQGRHDEALPWARQAQPPLAADGDDLRLLEPLAWLVASQGRPEEAAMIAGHVETAHRRAGLQRWPAAQARWQELGEKLLERLGREGLAVQQRLGMSIGREAAYRMALAASAATAPD